MKEIKVQSPLKKIFFEFGGREIQFSFSLEKKISWFIQMLTLTRAHKTTINFAVKIEQFNLRIKYLEYDKRKIAL